MLILRSLIFNVLGYSTLIMGCVVTSIIGVFNAPLTVKVWNYVFLPVLVWELKCIVGIVVEIRGQEYINQNAVLYAGKHQSALETYIIGNYLKKITTILKKELTYIPFFGWAQYFYGMIPVDRSAGSVAMKNMLKVSKQRILQNRPILIFPEGTRRKPGDEPCYKPGVVLLYQNLKLPVIPIATNTGLFWAKSSFLRHPGTVVFEFLPPIEAGLNKADFMNKLQTAIESKCDELNAQAIKQHPSLEKYLVKKTNEN